MEIYNIVYNETKNLSIAINSLLVYEGGRTAFLMDDMYLYENKKEELTKLFSEYFHIFDIGKGLLVVNKNITKKIDFSSSSKLGKLLSYPCVDENQDLENRKYVYTVIIKNKTESDEIPSTENTLMTTICIKNNDDTFRKIVEKFQGIVDIIGKNLKVVYIRNRIGNIENMIKKIKNKEKLKKYEKFTILNYFHNNEMFLLLLDKFENRNINIFKKKKFVLSMIFYCKYTENFDINKKVLFQKEMLDIYFDVKLSDDYINKNVSNFLEESYTINYNI